MHKIVEEIVISNEWRDGEFAKFKINASAVDEVLWCRMCVPMVYAHWEGYVVSSLKLLIEHLNELELLAINMPTKLVVVGLGDTYRFLSGKQSFDQRIEFTDRFRGLLQATVKFKKQIDTKSNLKSNVLKELCSMYGFDFEKFSRVTSELDRLVNVRNSIAHGENSFVLDMVNVNRFIDSVTTAMDILREEIERFLVNKGYLNAADDVALRAVQVMA